jgi:hypothetical protein
MLGYYYRFDEAGLTGMASRSVSCEDEPHGRVIKLLGSNDIDSIINK